MSVLAFNVLFGDDPRTTSDFVIVILGAAAALLGAGYLRITDLAGHELTWSAANWLFLSSSVVS
jgi:hypothetical protein